MDPEIVLLGLIFVNFGPLNSLPNTKPPISEAIHPNKIEKIIIFNSYIFKKYKNSKQNKNIKIIKLKLNNSLYNLFLNIFFAIFKNSKTDKTPKINTPKTEICMKLKNKKTTLKSKTDVKILFFKFFEII